MGVSDFAGADVKTHFFCVPFRLEPTSDIIDFHQVDCNERVLFKRCVYLGWYHGGKANAGRPVNVHSVISQGHSQYRA